MNRLAEAAEQGGEAAAQTGLSPETVEMLREAQRRAEAHKGSIDDLMKHLARIAKAMNSRDEDTETETIMQTPRTYTHDAHGDWRTNVYLDLDDAADVADGTPGSLRRAIDLIASALTAIPEEHRADACLEIKTFRITSHIDLWYERPAEETEIAAKNRERAEAADRQERLERAQLAHLKAKYEGG